MKLQCEVTDVSTTGETVNIELNWREMDREMMRALREDAEKLRHLTGEDHTPEFLADCETCGGLGYIAKTIHVYEPGCGFSHPDVEEKPCEACAGNGWFVCEAE